MRMWSRLGQRVRSALLPLRALLVVTATAGLEAAIRRPPEHHPSHCATSFMTDLKRVLVFIALGPPLGYITAFWLMLAGLNSF